MRHLKSFFQITEAKKVTKGDQVFWLVSSSNETYGHPTFEYVLLSDCPNPSDLDPQTEPDPYYGTSDYIISEDDDNSKKADEILAKQTGGVYDENYDYDTDDEEYQNWVDETKTEFAESYFATDLWGEIYLCVGKFDDTWELDDTISDPEREFGERPPNREEFEEMLNDSDEIKVWVRIDSGNITGSLKDFFDKNPKQFSKIFDNPSLLVKLPKNVAYEIYKIMGKPTSDIDGFEDAEEFGFL